MENAIPDEEKSSNYWDLNKKKLIFLALGILTGFVIVQALVAWKPKLGFLEFGFLFTFVGLYPAFLFRKVFKYKNFLGFIVNSGALSLVLLPMLIQFLGFIRANFIFTYTVQILYILGISGLIALCFHVRRINETLFNRLDFKWIDYLSIFFILLLTVVFSYRVLTSYQPAWDTFTYWGLDAKYLFEKNQLRDVNYTATGNFLYTSYYPIYYSIMYDLYGRIVEQFATWVNVYISLIALLLVYTRFSPAQKQNKLLALTILVLTAIGSAKGVFMFSIYADIVVPFVILFYAVVLLQKNVCEPKNYPLRAFLILSAILSLFFIKDGLYVVSIILLIVYIGHDWNYLKQNIKTLIKKPTTYILLFFFVSLLVIRHFSLEYIQTIPGLKKGFQAYRFLDVGFILRANYIVDLIKYLFTNATILTTIAFATFLYSLYLLVSKKGNKQTTFLTIISILLYGLFIGGYVISYRNLRSGSILRYTATIMYLPAFLLSLIEIKPKRVFSYMSIGLILLSSILLFQLGRSYLNSSEGIIEGNYCNSNQLSTYCARASDILSTIGDDKKIIVMDEIDELSFVNGNQRSIFLRYYLANNIVGGQFHINKQDFLSYAKKHEADWVYFFNFDYFQTCEIPMANGYLLEVAEYDVSDPLACDNLKEYLIPVD